MRVSAGPIAVGALVAVGFLLGRSVAPVVEVPGPVVTVQATPMPAQVVSVPGPTVVVTPRTCIDAVDQLSEALVAENDLLGAFLDDRVPTDAQIDRFLAVDPDAMYADVTACLAAQAIGS